MNIQDYLATLGIIVAPMAILQFLIGRWIEHRIAESIKNEYAKTLELHKGKIKKGEFVYQKKLELLEKMTEFSETYVPIRQDDSEDWSYACGVIIDGASNSELRLRSITAAYGYLLTDKAQQLMGELKTLINTMKHERTGCGIEPTKEGEKMASLSLDKLEEIMQVLKIDVLDGIIL